MKIAIMILSLILPFTTYGEDFNSLDYCQYENSQGESEFWFSNQVILTFDLQAADYEYEENSYPSEQLDNCWQDHNIYFDRATELVPTLLPANEL